MISQIDLHRYLTNSAQLGSQADLLIPPDFLDTPHVASIIKVVSVLVSLWLWGLAMWFFLICVGALWKYALAGHHMPFQMTWWSFVFPNTALVSQLSRQSLTLATNTDVSSQGYRHECYG